MKKRWMFAALVAILALAMIGCPTDGGGNGNGDGDGTMWTVSFELGTHGTGAVPAAKEVKDGYEIETSWLPSAPDSTDPDFMFSRWEVKGENVAARGYVVKKDIVLVAMWATPIDITFKMFKDDTVAPTVIKIPSGGTFEDAQKSFPTPVRAGEWQFAYWAFPDANGDPDPAAKVTVTTAFAEAATVIGHWYSTGFTLDTADEDNESVEKIRLTNGAMVIYEFDLAGAGFGTGGVVSLEDLQEITGITVSQQISEATYNSAQFRAFRVMGPYAYNDEQIIVNQGAWSTGDVIHGDFKVTADGERIAKIDGSGAYNVTDMRRFNKFHPYMIYNGTSEVGYNGGNGTYSWDKSAVEYTGPIVANEWFDVTYDLEGGADAKNKIPTDGEDPHGQALGQTLLRIKQAGTDVLPYGTNYNKVYFAIGPSTADANTFVTFLLKDVVLQIGGNNVAGVRPDWDNDPDTIEQTFFQYEIDSSYVNWRGKPGDTIVVRTPDPTGVEQTFEGPLDALHTDTNTSGYFYLRLSNVSAGDIHGTPASNGVPVVTFDGQFTEGPLVAAFTGGQLLRIELTPYQKEILQETTGVFTISVDGSTTGVEVGDPEDGGTASSKYRVGFANLYDSSWAVKLEDGKDFTFWDEPQPFAVAPTDLEKITHFIIQGGRSSSPDSTVTINSIKLAYVFEPPPPPVYPAADADISVITAANAVTITCAQEVTEGNYKNIEVPLDGSSNGNHSSALVVADSSTISITIPAGLQLGSYAGYTLKIEAYDADDTLITGEILQFGFVSDTSNFWNNRIGGDFGNTITDAGFIEHPFRAIEKEANAIKGIYFQNKVAMSKIVITEFTLIAPEPEE